MSYTPKILIVDDDARFCNSLKALLSNQGYQIQTSNSGKEAMEYLVKNNYDLVLLDIFMPDIGGHQIMDFINSQSPETLVIVITGHASMESAIESLRRGAYDYLRKPFESEELSKTVENALNNKRLEKEKKTIQGKLALTEQRYRYLVDNSPDIVYILDHEGRFTFINDTVDSLIGLKADEVIGNHYTSIVFEEDIDRAKYHFNERRTGNRAAVSTELRLKYYHNGDQLKPSEKRYLTVELKAMGMYDRPADSKDKKFTGTYGVGRDISARKQAEEALRESEDKYRTLFEDSRDPVYITTQEGKFIDANQSFLDLFGYTKEEMIDLNVKETYVNPDDPSRFQQDIEQKGSVRDFEVKLRKKDGTEMDCLITATVRRADDGSILGYHGIIRDITEKKRLEAQFQAAQRMEAIGTLAGGIAHEFNNKLVGISGNIDLLQMGLPDQEDISKYAERMKASALHMAHLTNQLLAYARGGKYQPKNISLTDVVEETLPLIKQTIAPSIRLETDLPRDILNVEADLIQMQMVLSALLNNSSEAIEDKGRIRIITKNEEIKEKLAKNHPGLRPGPYVSLTVEDDGKGMDEQTWTRIFDPFFTTKFQGRGLSMAAVYGIVKNHGGWISVDSQLGKGTVVRIYLPALKVQVKKEQKPRIEPAKGMGTILVIEDEDIVTDVIIAMLERLGYRALLAKTGKEAINTAKSFEGDIDVAVLDVALSDLTGKQVYRDIMEARPNLKVIVCSGYAIDGPPQEILDAGAQDFIQKPFSHATLSEKLKQVLEQK